MNILIVDDTNIMRMVMKDILIKKCKIDHGNIFEAKGGYEAVLRTKQAAPNVIFLDISMPDMDGITAIEKILEIEPDCKIVMCTASRDREDLKKCILAGAKDYILKPPSPWRVAKAVGVDLPEPPGKKVKVDELDILDEKGEVKEEEEDEKKKPDIKTELAGEKDIEDMKAQELIHTLKPL